MVLGVEAALAVVRAPVLMDGITAGFGFIVALSPLALPAANAEADNGGVGLAAGPGAAAEGDGVRDGVMLGTRPRRLLPGEASLKLPKLLLRLPMPPVLPVPWRGDGPPRLLLLLPALSVLSVTVLLPPTDGLTDRERTGPTPFAFVTGGVLPDAGLPTLPRARAADPGMVTATSAVVGRSACHCARVGAITSASLFLFSFFECLLGGENWCWLVYVCCDHPTKRLLRRVPPALRSRLRRPYSFHEDARSVYSAPASVKD